MTYEEFPMYFINITVVKYKRISNMLNFFLKIKYRVTGNYSLQIFTVENTLMDTLKTLPLVQLETTTLCDMQVRTEVFGVLQGRLTDYRWRCDRRMSRDGI